MATQSLSRDLRPATCDLRLATSSEKDLRPLTYGTMYGMRKTTIYLPDELKASLEQLALQDGRPEAELIREALRTAISKRKRPRPRLPLTEKGLGNPAISERVDDYLEGFGQK